MSLDNNIINFPKNKNISFPEIEERLIEFIEGSKEISNNFADYEMSYDNKNLYSMLINCLGEIQNFVFYKIENTFPNNLDRCITLGLLIDILDTQTKYDEVVN